MFKDANEMLYLSIPDTSGPYQGITFLFGSEQTVGFCAAV
jgi:hypothetical protein